MSPCIVIKDERADGPESFALNDEGLCPESYYSNTLRVYAPGAYSK